MFTNLRLKRPTGDSRAQNAAMNTATKKPPLTTSNRKPEPVQPMSRRNLITPMLDRWLVDVKNHLGDLRLGEVASDGTWASRTARTRANALLRDLADNEDLLLACVEWGVQRPLEWLREHPHDWPLPIRKVGQMARCDWRICISPFDVWKESVVTIDDPLKFLGWVAESAIPRWLANFNGTAAPAGGLPADARAFLVAMLALELHGGARAAQPKIWDKVAESGEAIEGKGRREAALSVLKDRKLILSKSGKGMGTTLTQEGYQAASAMCFTRNSE